VLAPAPARAEKLHPQFKKLLNAFQKSTGLSAEFREEKRIALLDEPLVNQGRLYFERPVSFARIIDKPHRSGMFLKQKQLLLWDGKKTRRMDLRAGSAVTILAESFLAVLAGDHPRLTEIYKVDFLEQGDGKWTLELVPKKEALARIVTSLAFAGRELTLLRMTLTESSGDVSVSRFSNVKHNRSFSSAERKRYFAPPER
jgi:outer membrane lipoprotein-sorting protein